ncbi:unnamed protein product, partial [Dicrocoelium dendriticum]
LLKLVKEPNNSFCADCGELGPLWASWNLGVFLCVRCATVHRKMGTHVSKVKSLQLDSWNKEQFQRLADSNNVRSRKLYEATLPAGFIRPQSDSALEIFIRAKYEHLRFTKRHDSTEPNELTKTPTASVPFSCNVFVGNDLIDFETPPDESLLTAPLSSNFPPTVPSDHSAILSLYNHPPSGYAAVGSQSQLISGVPTPVTHDQSDYYYQIKQQLIAINAEKKPTAINPSST